MIELIKQPIGTEGEMTIKLEGGKIKVELSYSPEKFINELVDKLEQAIPGDQTVKAAALKALIKAKLS